MIVTSVSVGTNIHLPGTLATCCVYSSPPFQFLISTRGFYNSVSIKHPQIFPLHWIYWFGAGWGYTGARVWYQYVQINFLMKHSHRIVQVKWYRVHECCLQYRNEFEDIDTVASSYDSFIRISFRNYFGIPTSASQTGIYLSLSWLKQRRVVLSWQFGFCWH